MHSASADLAGQLETALAERRHLLPRGFALSEAARCIAASYVDRADGGSAFWIARARWPAHSGRPADRAVFEVLRADGRHGVWDACTRDEAEVIADLLTCLSF